MAGQRVLAAVVFAAIVTWSEAVAEMNSAHIPPTPDPALSRPVGSRQYQGYQIQVAPVVTIPVKMPLMLRNACRTTKDISGCMFFASEQLHCECVRRDNGWGVDARVEFVPVMYLREARFKQHELQHLDHVTELLSAHLRKLVSRNFTSKAACAAAAEQEKGAFLDLMNGFRAASNRKLH